MTSSSENKNDQKLNIEECEETQATSNENNEETSNSILTSNEQIQKDKENGKGKHAKTITDIPAYEARSKRMRKNLYIAIVAGVLILVAIGICTYFWITSEQGRIVQQTQTQSADVTNIENNNSESSKTQKNTTVPELASLIGKNIDEGFATIGHGAVISSDMPHEAEGDPIKRILNVTLAGDESDSRSGAPSLILNVGEDSNIISVSYSSSIKTLGYGQISFADALINQKIIEKIFKEAGLTINETSFELPANKSEYATFASDGVTVMSEEKTFDGEGQGAGQALKWTGKLSYDYSVATSTDNLSDTIRTIQLSISR